MTAETHYPDMTEKTDESDAWIAALLILLYVSGQIDKANRNLKRANKILDDLKKSGLR